MTQTGLWEDEKSDALLGNMLPTEGSEKKQDAPVDPVPVTPDAEEKSP